MEIERPDDWEEKKDLANYLLEVIEADTILRNKFARLIVDIFEHKTERNRVADNPLTRQALYHIIKQELIQDVTRKATESGNERPWWVDTG